MGRDERHDRARSGGACDRVCGRLRLVTSPCVLPLVPGYLSFVSGIGFDDLGARPGRVVASTAAFVAGFGSMFVALGAGVAWFGNALIANRRPLEIAAGIFVILAANRDARPAAAAPARPRAASRARNRTSPWRLMRAMHQKMLI
ncbi:MAG: cytochrome c biogenesis CcdA family protein [Gaiellaceae bacterium]